MKKMLDKVNEKWFYVFSDLFNKASIYFLALAFSYIVLPEQYGSLSLFNSLVTLFFVFISLNLTHSYVTKKRLDDNCNFKDILSTIITFIFIMNILFIIIAVILFSFDITIYSISPKIIFCSIFTAILTSNYELLQTVLVTEKDKKRYLINGLCFSILLVILSFTILFLFKKINIYAIIFSKIFLLFAFSIYSLFYLKKKYDFKLKINLQILKEALVFSAPLILHSLSGFVLNYFDKFMINDIQNLKATAVYSFSYNLSSVMMVISIALNKALIPRFFPLKTKDANEEINKLISKDLKTMCYLYVLYISSVGFIYSIFPTTYNNSILIFLLLTYNYLLFYGYNVYSNYLYYRGKTVKIFINTLTSGIVNIILNVFLIKQYGSLGATISTVISFILLFVLYYLSVKRQEKEYFPVKKFIKSFFIAGVVSFVYYLCYNYFVLRLLFLASVLIFSFFQAKKLKIFKEVKLWKKQ